LQVLPTSNPRASDLKDNMPYVLQTEMHEVNATKRKVGMYSSKSNYKSKEFFGKILKFATGSKYTSTSTAYTTTWFQWQNKKGRVHWQNHSLFFINS
jgi:hypothetical protein